MSDTHSRRPLNLFPLQEAVKTGVAAAIGTIVYQAMSFDFGFWVVISAVIVMQGNVGASFKAASVRIVGTVVGAVVGAVFGALHEVNGWTMGGATACSVFICCAVPALRDGSRLAGVTAVIVLINAAASPLTIASERSVQSFIGIMIALGVAIFVWPSRARDRLRDGVGGTLRADLLVYRLIYEKQTTPHEDTQARDDRHQALQAARQELHTMVEANHALMLDARREPAFLSKFPAATLMLNADRIAEHLLIMDGHSAATPDAALPPLFQPELAAAARESMALFEAIAQAVSSRGPLPSTASLHAAASALRAKFMTRRGERVFYGFDIDSVIAVLTLIHGMLEVAGDLELLVERAMQEA